MRSLVITGVSLAVPLIMACGPTQPTGVGGTGGGTGNAFCPVKQLMDVKCSSCHATDTGTAGFKINSYADTQKTSRLDPTRKVWQVMKERVANGSMPMGSALTNEQKAVFANWNGSGSECNSTGPVGTRCTPGDKSPTQSCDPGCIGEACLSQYCQITHKFVAHAGVGNRARYPVGAGTTDDYRCFTFRNPFFGTQTVVTGETPIIDGGNPLVVHHWLLFGSNAGGQDDSVSGSGCVTPELRDKLLSGWAQGGTAYVLANDIGLQMNQYQYLILQTHYNNTGGNQSDASGVAFCTQPTPRQNTGMIVTLGTDNIFIPGGANNVVGGTGICDAGIGGTGLAKSGQSVYVIGSSPHMHKLGSGFTTTHTRGGTKLPNISNIPNGTWKFDGQAKYLLPRIEVRPGDSLVTQCTYSNPSPLFAGFGIGTASEMCYDFMMVYPLTASRGECGQGVTFSNQ